MAWGIKNTSASRTSLLLGTEPVWATIVAVAIGGELMGPLGIIGALLIIGGTFCGQAVETRHRLGSSSGESAT
jgi:drug/metabolite transporter (DMT)-like permease